MKRISSVLAALAWVCMWWGTAPAATKADKPKKPAGALPKEYAWMTKDLILLDEQQSQVVEKLNLKTFNKVAAEIRKADQDRLKELKSDLVKAQKEKDKQAAEEIRAQIIALEADKTKVSVRARDRIEGEILTSKILTPEQKTKWASHEACRDVVALLKPVVLTADQAARARELCAARSEGLLANWGASDPTKVKNRQEIIKAVVEEVKEKTLTDEQRKLLPKDKDDKGKGGDGSTGEDKGKSKGQEKGAGGEAGA